jgi:hypothetical protein
MQDCEGHSEESARAICGKIAQEKVSNRQIAPTGQEGVHMDYKAQLLALLGLSADASDEAIGNKKTEIATLKNRAEAAEAKVLELEKAKLEAQVEKDLDGMKDRITNREEAKVLLLKNREDGLKLLALVKPAAPAQALLNREDGNAPAAEAAVQRLADQRKVVDEIKLKNRCSETDAWALAVSLKPELFVSKQ